MINIEIALSILACIVVAVIANIICPEEKDINDVEPDPYSIRELVRFLKGAWK